MKKQKISIIIGTTALMLGTLANANAGEIKVTPNFSLDTVVVEGMANASEQITIMLFEDGTTPENYWSKIPAGNIKNTVASGASENFETVAANAGDTVSFVDDFYADSEGMFSHTIGLKETGVYDVYLRYSDSGELKIIENVNFTDSDEYKEKIEEINDADKNGFIEEITKSETQKLLGFDNISLYLVFIKL